jgi:hypothetical protein
LIDGIYLVLFRGSVDWGTGMLVMRRGVLTGADQAGVLFDGTYQDQGFQVLIDLHMTVPAGVPLVQGSPAQPFEYKVRANLRIPRAAFDHAVPALLEMPPGPVNAIFRRLRALND